MVRTVARSRYRVFVFHLVPLPRVFSIVNADNKIVGIGYNGFPIGCSDDDLPWARHGPELDTKYPVRCSGVGIRSTRPSARNASLVASRCDAVRLPCRDECNHEQDVRIPQGLPGMLSKM